ncbi:hypothetical protein BDZ89DRAFT_1207452, partial [Hymenopellis radicata]
FSSSTRNTKIERTWVEVGRQFVRLWRAFFYHLERLHGLDRNNPSHLWLLHYLFLDEINEDCDKFQEEYNLHPIGGEGHDNTPMDMYLNDLLGAGIHVSMDDFEGVDPEILEQVYGVDGNEKKQTSGAEHEDDDMDSDEASEMEIETEEEEEEEEIDDLEGFPEQPKGETEIGFWKQLLIGLRDKFLPKAVHTPRKTCPFDGNEIEDVFAPLLAEMEDSGKLPEGYGLLESEWQTELYPSFEILRSGRKGSKELRIALRVEDWQPKAVRWGRALHIMNTMIAYEMETS